MNENTIQLLIIVLYRAFGILCGLISVYFGYRLFSKGIFSDAGEMDATFSNNKVLLKKAAPGTFFALFGLLIISVIGWRGLTVKIQTPITGEEADSLKIKTIIIGGDNNIIFNKGESELIK
jgi:hypothetical protein